MSNNYVSFNIKAKKKCDADAMIFHLENSKLRNRSSNITLKHLSKFNVSSDSIHLKYKNVIKKIESIKNKKIQKNANIYLEGVLAFSYEQVSNIGVSEFRERAPALIEEYAKKIADEFGFEYLGYSLHFDEGQIESELDPSGRTVCVRDENGRAKINYHAHISFVNYDLKLNKSRFREYQQKYISNRKIPNLHFVEMQNLAGSIFGKLGFSRGLSKMITNHRHVEKELLELEITRREQDDLVKTTKTLIEKHNIIVKAAHNAVKMRDEAILEADTIRASSEILKARIRAIMEQFENWMSAITSKFWLRAKVNAGKVAELVDTEIVEQLNLVDTIESIEQQARVPEHAKLSSLIRNKMKFK